LLTRHLTPPISSLFPYTTLFRSRNNTPMRQRGQPPTAHVASVHMGINIFAGNPRSGCQFRKSRSYRKGFLLIVSLLIYRFSYVQDRKSTRLNSSHVSISYAVFCL